MKINKLDKQAIGLFGEQAALIPSPIAARECKCGCGTMFIPTRKDKVGLSFFQKNYDLSALGKSGLLTDTHTYNTQHTHNSTSNQTVRQ